MSNQQTMESLDSLLNSTVDDLIDLKEFKPLPVGQYRMIFDWEKSEAPLGVRVHLRVQEVIELADPSEENLAQTQEPDAKETILFNFFTKDGEANSFGQGELKNMVNEVLMPTFGGATTGETLDNAKGAEVIVTLAHRKSTKDGETKFYPSLKSIELA